MNRIFNILLCLTIAGCNSSTDRKTAINSDTLSSVSVNADTTENILTTTTHDFNVNKFLASADSLLTTIIGKQIHFSVSVDTITASKANELSDFYALHPSDKSLIKRYSFDPGKGSRELRLWFIDATYSDTLDLIKTFEELKVLSGKVSEHDHSPGLTYTNNYVIRTDKKIYWLNSGCSYAFFNHQKLNGFIRQSLQLESITDSIHCKCGQPICDTANFQLSEF